MPSHFLLAAPFPTLSLHPLQHLAQVLDSAAEGPREAVEAAVVAAGGRVEGKSRIGDYEAANHAPIQEVCDLKLSWTPC